MGGAADHSERSSSPLKRRASELDAEIVNSIPEDVDMILVPSSDPAPVVMSSKPTPTPRPQRAQSIDMLNGEPGLQRVELDDEDEEPITVTGRSASMEIPSIDAQISVITTLYETDQQKQPLAGDKVYLVSKRWLNRVISRGTEALKTSKEQPEGEIGPVDNSDLTQQIIKDINGVEHVLLKPGAGEEQFRPLSKDAWDLLMDWYGLMQGAIPIERVAHDTSVGADGLPNVQFEYYPPVFTIHRLYGDNNPINIPQKLKAENPTAPVFVLSRACRYLDFLKMVKTAANIPLKNKVRVWRVPRLLPAAEPSIPIASTATPPPSRPGSPAADTATQREPQDSWTGLFLDVPSFNQLEKNVSRELVDFRDFSTDSNYNGNSNLSFVGLGDTQTVVLDEFICGSGTGDMYVSNYVSSKDTRATSTALTRTNGKNQNNSGRNSPAPSGPVTRGRAQKAGRQMGTSGLSNLGNTCYMNSALQCVRSVEELTKYFLTGTAKEEINEHNPLGNNGDVAKAYEALLSEIYHEPVPTSVAPRYFKTTIGRYAPSFSGWAQQDSQEFLGFLLDGLQEDLSRVKKKPYIEKPDSTDEMVNNPEAIRELAAQVWDITKKRDDSVIADLFTGMYKSTLVCPVCAKVSITFDPFNNLTLQLPIENSWSHDVFFYPLNARPIRISVDIDKHAPISALKEFISKRVGVSTKRLFAAEEHKNKFYKIYEDTDTASEAITSSDIAVVHELEYEPTNWPAPEKPKRKGKSYHSYGNNQDDDDLPGWDDPVAARLVVPVFHRRPSGERNFRASRYSNIKPWIFDAVPHFITVTPEEARNEDTIRRKILEKVMCLTTSNLLDEESTEHSDADSAEADMIITTNSDADSSGDNKVVAHSVDGEEGLVDVIMNDTTVVRESVETANSSAHQSEEADVSSCSPRFSTQRPSFVNPEVYLDPRLQNLFSLSYFAGSKEYVPTGWGTSVDEEKTYPPLSSRNPYVSQSLDTNSISGYEDSNGRASSDTSDRDNLVAKTRMNEESSDEDEDIPAKAPHALPLRAKPGRVNVGNKSKKRNIKTYSKKGKQLAKSAQNMASPEQDAPDDGPLIRLGEGIVVDWAADAWDDLFNGDNGDGSMRGYRTWGKSEVPYLPDPELDAKRKARMHRKKTGITLDDCLDEFGKVEVLSEQDTWYCPRCKEHRRATKKFELWKTPDILVMHLKRFSSAAYRRDKLDVLVDFPIEGLDLTSRAIETEEGKHEIYDLIAVDDHYGGLGGGHYTAFAKNFLDGQWYEYNDSSASMLKDVSRVVSSSAYLLFYRRRSEVPLGGPRFQEIFRKYENPNEPSDDEESGEDQGLVGNSSLRGSSSPLTGAGAAHQANGFHHGAEMTTINPTNLEKLPSYASDDDDAPLLGDSAMNDPQASIEDEGIDMSLGYNSVNRQNLSALPHATGGIASWTFNALNNNSRDIVSGAGSDNEGVGSEIDGASDAVNHDSSASETSLRNRIADFDDAQALDDLDRPYEDASPVPDLDEDGQAAAISLRADMLDGHMHYPAAQYEDERLEVEEPAAEIHLEDHDDIKID